eukprot:3169688-Prymnesium_polylepis.1
MHLPDEQRRAQLKVGRVVLERGRRVEVAVVGRVRVHLRKVERRARLATRGAPQARGRVVVVQPHRVGDGVLRPAADGHERAGCRLVDRRRLLAHERQHLLHRDRLRRLRPAGARPAQRHRVKAWLAVRHAGGDGALRFVDDLPAAERGLVG